MKLWQRFRRWPRWAQIATVVIVIAIIAGAAASGGNKKKPSAAAATTTATTTVATTSQAKTTQASKVPASIRRWGSKMGVWSSNLSQALSMLASATQDTTGLLTKGSNTQMRAVVALAVLGNCSKTLDAIKVPNDPRVHRVVRILHHACASFQASAKHFASGVDNLSVSLIRRAAREMTEGKKAVVRATPQVRAITSSS